VDTKRAILQVGLWFQPVYDHAINAKPENRQKKKNIVICYLKGCRQLKTAET